MGAICGLRGGWKIGVDVGIEVKVVVIPGASSSSLCVCFWDQEWW